MTPEQHISKTERIAELEWRREQLQTAGVATDWERDDKIAEIETELSRLRNEGGDSKTEEGRGDLERARWDEAMDAWRTWQASDAFYKGGQTRQSSFVDGYLAARDTPSPLAPVEAGRGEREARELDDGFPPNEQTRTPMQRAVSLAYEAGKCHERIMASPTARDIDRFDECEAEIRKILCSGIVALSQGNGGEAVYLYRWRDQNIWHAISEAEYLKLAKNEELEVLKLHAAPSSPPEGVREALGARIDKAEEIVVNLFLGSSPSPRRIVRELAEAELFSPTTPSRGLVDAAEWHEAQAANYVAQKEKASKGGQAEGGLILGTIGLLEETHRECAQHFRTLSEPPMRMEAGMVRKFRCDWLCCVLTFVAGFYLGVGHEGHAPAWEYATAIIGLPLLAVALAWVNARIDARFLVSSGAARQARATADEKGGAR